MKKILTIILILIVGSITFPKGPPAHAGGGKPSLSDGNNQDSENSNDESENEDDENNSNEVEGNTPEIADPEPMDVTLEGRKTYVIVPDDYKDLYAIAMDSENNKYAYGLTEDEEIELGFLKDININSREYYDNLKLFEVSTEASGDIKLVVGYKVLNKDRYVLLSSENIDETKLTNNYEDGETLRIINLKDYAVYSEFPGYEVGEEIIMTGIRVGTDEMRESERDPSNIVKKFVSENSDIEGVGVNILPSASWSMFHMYALEGNKTYGIKNNNNNKVEGEYTQITTDTENLAVRKVVINPKNGGAANNKIILNGKLISLDHDELYTFEGSMQASVVQIGGSGQGNWVLNLTGTVGSIPDGAVDLPTEETYVIGDQGLIYEAALIITSGENGFRKRESTIEINVLGSEGIGVRSIKE